MCYNNFDGKYGIKRLLTSADDLNNITDNGIYWYLTENVPSHAPYNNASVVEVFGSSSSSTQKMQRVTRYGVSGQSALLMSGLANQIQLLTGLPVLNKH